MSTLARELAELIVDRDSFMVDGSLTGRNRVDYEETVKHYTNIISGGLRDIKSIKSVKAGGGGVQGVRDECIVPAFRAVVGCDSCGFRSECKL